MYLHTRRKIAVVILLALALLWLSNLIRGIPAFADDQPKSPDADVTVSADDIKKDFASDEAAAKAKYLNKIIRVTGTLKTVADFDVDGNYAFTLDGTPAVNCIASKSGSKGCKSISIGQQATVQGKCTTATADSFALSYCQMISLGKDPSIKVSAADLAKAFATKTGTDVYEGVCVTVDGTIASVDADAYKIFLDGFTAADGTAMKIKCLVGVSGGDALAKLAKGSKVIVKGTCIGMNDSPDVVIQFAVLQE
jgi:tRNA_anti-like